MVRRLASIPGKNSYPQLGVLAEDNRPWKCANPARSAEFLACRKQFLLRWMWFRVCGDARSLKPGRHCSTLRTHGPTAVAEFEETSGSDQVQTVLSSS